MGSDDSIGVYARAQAETRTVPLTDRLATAKRAICQIMNGVRDPIVSVPPGRHDDDIVILTAIDDAIEALAYCENAMFAALTAGGLYEPVSVDWSVRDGRNAEAVRLLHGAMAAIGAFFDVPESAGTGRNDNGSR